MERSTDRSLELSKLLRSDGNLAERVSITAFGKKDGGGAQCFAILSAILFAHEHQIRYLHTPFTRVSHQPRECQDWTRKWEGLLALGEGHASCSEPELAIPVHRFLENPDTSGPVVLYAEHFHGFGNANPDLYRNVIAPLRLRLKRRQSILKRIFGPRRRLAVAVHVRRGDVTAERHVHRYTPDDIVIRKIDATCSVLKQASKNFSVKIYSEGAPEDFRAFRDKGYAVILGRSPFVDFVDMALADVLVCARSSFSVLAGLFCEGTVIYEDCYHKPQSDWIRSDPSGTIDMIKFGVQASREP